MAEEARRGLAWRREHNRGGTEIGVARARNISNRDMLPIETINRMVSYFARHEADKQGEGFSPGEPGFPSAGRIAWALWGGDAGQTWANAIVERVNDTTARAANAYAGDMIYLTSSNVKIAAAAEGETEAPARTIEGVAVPYNTVAVVSGGEKVMFLPGSLPVDG